jgi:hypothetical protein
MNPPGVSPLEMTNPGGGSKKLPLDSACRTRPTSGGSRPRRLRRRSHLPRSARCRARFSRLGVRSGEKEGVDAEVVAVAFLVATLPDTTKAAALPFRSRQPRPSLGRRGTAAGSASGDARWVHGTATPQSINLSAQ